MNATQLIGSVLLFSALAASVGTVPARAAEAGDETVILVAKPALRDRLYGATILISKPPSPITMTVGFLGRALAIPSAAPKASPIEAKSPIILK